MVMQLVIAFLIANLLNVKRLPLRNVYKTILMFPWAMPGYVSILLWKTGMFNSEFGLLTQWIPYSPPQSETATSVPIRRKAF